MNANITVLKDESLGGVEREYREVNRKARVGERIKIVAAEYDTGGQTWGYDNGEVHTVVSSDAAQEVNIRPDGTIDSEIYVEESEYITLERTDILRIDGARFRMVDRKAAMGERVIITGERATFEIGEVFVVEDVDWAYPAAGLRNGHNAIDGHYHVLEPVESAEAAEPLSAKPAPDQAAEIIAKLTTRVSSLERRVAALETPKSRPATDEEVADVLRLRLRRPVCGGVAKLSRAKSPQEIRDDIIKRAKEDVEKLIADAHGDNLGAWESIPALEDVGHVTIKFVVDRQKRKVTALAFLRYASNGIIPEFTGRAKCAPGDVFNASIGRAIALRRALGLEIPEEYVSAPQPTEVRVGDVVKIVGNDGTHYYEIGDAGRVIKRVDNGEKYATIVGTKTNEEHRMRGGYQQHVLDADYVVIDDSRIGEAESDSAEPRKEVA